MTTELARFRVTWATSPAPPARHYSAAQGAFLALLRAHDPALAQVLHDDPGPKPYALSPLTIEASPDQPGRASLMVGCWATTIAEALTHLAADGPPLDLAGSTGILLDCQCCTRASVADLLADAAADPHTTTTGNVHVAFTTPTCFSLGRLPGGSHRYAITPDPCYSIAAWWRRWQALGGATFAVPSEGAGPWLTDRVIIRRLTWQSATIRGGKTALTGGTGRVTYAWAGPEPWGPTFLGALARCAVFTSTGAKTTQGMGQTALAPPEARDGGA